MWKCNIGTAEEIAKIKQSIKIGCTKNGEAVFNIHPEIEYKRDYKYGIQLGVQTATMREEIKILVDANYSPTRKSTVENGADEAREVAYTAIAYLLCNIANQMDASAVYKNCKALEKRGNRVPNITVDEVKKQGYLTAVSDDVMRDAGTVAKLAGYYLSPNIAYDGKGMCQVRFMRIDAWRKGQQAKAKAEKREQIRRWFLKK